MTPTRTRTAVARYGVAVAAWVAAMLLRRAVDPVLEGATSLTAYPAIMSAAWYGGIGPGVLCTLLCGLTALYYFIEPSGALAIVRTGDSVTLVGFVLVGSALSALIHALTRARAQADAQRRWFRQTLSGIGDGVIATDVSGHVEFMNPVAEALTGWTSADAAGRSIREVFNIRREGTAEVVENPVERVLAGGTVAGLANHTELHGRDGTVRPIDDSGAPVRDEDGTTIGAVVVFRNVSERRHYDRELQASRDRLVHILESTGDGFVAVDAEWRITGTNAAAERILRKSRAELRGRNAWHVYPDARATEGAAHLERAMRERVTVHYDSYFAPLETWFEVSAYPAEDGLSIFFRDITRRKKAAEEIAEAHALLDAFFENAPVGLALWDRERRYVRVNRALARMNGVPAETHVGRTVPEVLPRMGPEVQAAFARVLSTAEPLVGQEVSGETPASPGTLRHWSVSYYPIRIDGEVMFVSAVCEDITERKQAEQAMRAVTEQLHGANESLQLFVYAASHDLQEPLRMVTGYLGLLEARYGSQLGEDAREFIGYAVDGAKRMEALLEDLRQYWQAASQTGFPGGPTDAGKAMRAALGNLSAAVAQSGAVITNEDLPVVRTDETPLVQIFQNLIGNAIKYRRDEQPAIHISAEREEPGMWSFSVRDNGIGISREYRDEIFNPFTRLHGRETPGTGLGLALVQKIVERYGGRIWMESQPGAGSVFRFTLPGADGQV